MHHLSKLRAARRLLLNSRNQLCQPGWQHQVPAGVKESLDQKGCAKPDQVTPSACDQALRSLQLPQSALDFCISLIPALVAARVHIKARYMLRWLWLQAQVLLEFCQELPIGCSGEASVLLKEDLIQLKLLATSVAL